MRQKLKLGLGAAGFCALLVFATLAYNKLSRSEQTVTPNDVTVSPQKQGNTAETARQKAPDFTMTDINRNSVQLSNLIANGKPIVINFWASWCPPCKVEMPDFDKLYKETGDEVQFIMLDLTDGQRETVEKGARYVQDQGFSFPVYFDTGQEAAYTYGIRSIPTTLFIDKDGYIVSGAQGAINEITLRRGIKLLKPEVTQR
jgi:thiol-disulfide isomerase/thioredoxin